VRQDKRPANQITIQVAKDGTLYLGTAKSITVAALKKVLRDRVKVQGNEIPILIRGDGKTLHKHIRKAMDACAESGLYRIRIAGLQQAGAK
jgi:biopolymer transport protein ExbD